MVIEIIIVGDPILVSLGFIGFYGIGRHFSINNNYNQPYINSLFISVNSCLINSAITWLVSYIH